VKQPIKDGRGEHFITSLLPQSAGRSAFDGVLRRGGNGVDTLGASGWVEPLKTTDRHCQ